MTGQMLVKTSTLDYATGWATPASPAAPLKKTTIKTVVSSVTATDLLNGEFTIAAGLLGANGILRFTAWGDWKQNSGANTTGLRMQLLLGGVTLFDTGTNGTTAANGTGRWKWRVEAMINNGGAQNVQTCDFRLTLQVLGSGLAAPVGLVTVGTGAWHGIAGASGNAGIGWCEAFNTAAVDTSLAAALVLNVINPANNALCDTRLTGALAEFR